MPGPKITKAGNVLIKKVGHTTGPKHGLNPMLKMRGEPQEPSPITFGGGK